MLKVTQLRFKELSPINQQRNKPKDFFLSSDVVAVSLCGVRRERVAEKRKERIEKEKKKNYDRAIRIRRNKLHT